MNNNCKAIHETALRDIIDIYDAIKNIPEEDRKNLFSHPNKSKGPMGNASSIAKASSNLTLVFPAVCSRNISIENASMIAKALEKNDVSMMQRLFASWQVVDGDSIKNFQDYLGAFHKNISTKVADLDDVFKIYDDFHHEAAVTALEAKAIKDDMDNINFTLPDPISEHSLMRYSIHEDSNGDPFANVADMRGGFRPKYDSASKDYANASEEERSKMNKPNKSGLGSAKTGADLEKTRAEFFKNQVPDSEYKKANELMPTTMAVNFYVTNGEGGAVQYDGALAGIKCKLYPVSSDDIVNNLSSKVGGRNWLTQFLRATTREISFMKDFVLAIDKAKIDAMSMSDRRRTTDKMWKVLERRALTSRLNRLMRRGDGASVAAITTLIISQEEVEYLRKYYSIDMEKVGTAMGLFESLNLMCLVIVDESLEVAKFIYDEQEPMWETISFTHLERESSDNTYKRVVNLMTKVAR